MKKKLCLGLLIALMMTSLWANGQGESGTATDQAKPVRILSPGDKAADQDKVMDYIARESGHQVEWIITSWGDYKNKVQVMLAAGDPFELCFDASWMSFGSNASKGAYLDITEMLPEAAPDLYKQISQDDWKAVSLNQKIYGIPWMYPKTERRCFRIREDLRIKYNLPEPKNMTDFELYLQTIKENEDLIPYIYGGDGILIDYMTDYGLAGLGPQNLDLYYFIEDDDIKIYAAENLPMFKELITRAHDWYEKGYVPVDVITARQNHTYEMQQGNLAGSYWLYENDEQYTAQLQSKGVEEGIIKSYPIYDQVSFRSPASNNMYAMNANAENPEAALKFIQWVHASQDNYDILMYGIPGEHWTLENGLVKYLPNITESKYFNWPAPYPNWDINLLRPAVGEPADKYEIAEEHAMNNTIAYPTAGFIPDLSPIKTEVALRSSLRNDKGMGLEYGILDPADLEEYRTDQKPHTDVIIAELQKQLDAWKAANK